MKKQADEITIGDELIEIYFAWVAVLKEKGAPDYEATPDNFGWQVARMLWKAIGKGGGK